MKFSVLERVLLGSMMAGYKGSFTNLKLLRVGREVLSFNDEETQKLKFVETEKGGMSWNPEAAIALQAVEIEFDVTVTNVIKGMMKKMNEAEELTEQHFSLCEKFLI